MFEHGVSCGQNTTCSKVKQLNTTQIGQAVPPKHAPLGYDVFAHMNGTMESPVWTLSSISPRVSKMGR